MKHFLSVLVFTFVTAFVFFAVMRWGFHTETGNAMSVAIGALAGGLVVEAFRRYRNRKP